VIDLNNPKLSFILLSSNSIDDLTSVLYAKCYQLMPIKGYYRNQYEDSVLAWGDFDNDEMRQDLLFLLQHFSQDCGFIKYTGETDVRKVYRDGSERNMATTLYNADEDNVSYLLNGLSFSFVERVRYWKPKKLEDFKVGMIVEYMNGNKWYQKKVENPNKEWNDMFMLLVKYDKLRVVSNN
jgi:hypothetical protein